MIILSKLRAHRFCYGLSNFEFMCRCKAPHCKCTIISPSLIEAYSKFRTTVDMPIHLTCGYRCPEHNCEVGGKALSRHQLGEALDIIAAGLIKKYGSPEEVIKIACKCGFVYVHFYKGKGIFHLDTRGGNNGLGN